MSPNLYIRPLISLFLTVFIIQFSYSQIPLDGLVGYYMLDGDATDSSDMSNDGQIVDRANAAENRFGEVDKALLLDGGYIDAGNPTAFRLTDAISISIWLNPRVISDWSAVVTKWGGFGAGGYYLGVNPANAAVRWNLDMPTPIEGNTLDNGKWTHITTTYDGNSVKVFENGTMVSSIAYSDPIVNNSADLYIGNQFDFPSDFRFNGVIDDVLIYNRGLSDEEVREIYDAQVTSTNNIFLDRSVNVFPSPVENILRVENKSEYPILSYSLYNAAGKQVRNATFQEEIDISNEPAGLYYLLLNFDDITTTKKFIKE